MKMHIDINEDINKDTNKDTNKDMNKHLVQIIAKDYNDHLKDDELIHILTESNNIIHNCYDEIAYGDVDIAFIDEDGKGLTLLYENVVGVKVRVS